VAGWRGRGGGIRRRVPPRAPCAGGGCESSWSSSRTGPGSLRGAARAGPLWRVPPDAGRLAWEVVAGRVPRVAWACGGVLLRAVGPALERSRPPQHPAMPGQPRQGAALMPSPDSNDSSPSSPGRQQAPPTVTAPQRPRRVARRRLSQGMPRAALSPTEVALADA
jgi:hypothetical protein